MADQKIFAGPRIRRVRNGLQLTQTAMAEALGISPSYLNLIERNQRPLTVQLLLKLGATFKIDLEELQGSGAATVTALKEVFTDPLIAGELPGDQELIEIADAAPNAAAGIVRLHRAYREQAERLSDLSALLAGEGHEALAAGARLPADAVREAMERRPHYFDRLDRAAEAFHQALSPGDDLGGALREWLRREHGVAVRSLPVHVMPDLKRRYDRHSLRLFLSERLSPFDRLREMALSACQFALGEVLDEEVAALELSGDEAMRIARAELAHYAAHALMMPYSAFLTAARRTNYDVAVLAARFNVSFEQAASRLVTLQRPGEEGLSFFLMEIDHAGNVLRRAGAQGFPQSRFGGDCPRLGLYAAFAQPGEIIAETVELGEGASFLTISRTVEAPHAGYGERVRRAALLLGCDLDDAAQTIYGRTQTAHLAIGRACRICELRGCLSRAEPPVTRPLGLDHTVSGLTSFDFR